MRKKLVIIGLVLLLAGTAAFAWVLTKQRKERRLVASYKLKYASEVDEYLKQYNEWSQLAPEERARLPWGLDKYREAKTEIQLRREQQERLKADLDKLAAGETDVYPFADVLYGENWQEELRKYKAQNKLRELAFTGSTMCMLTGGTIFAGCLLSWTAVLTALGAGHLKKFSTDVFRQCKEVKNKYLTEADATKERSKALIKSGWQNFNKNYADPAPIVVRRKTHPAPGRKRQLRDNWCGAPAQPAFSMRSEPCPDDSPENTQEIAVLLSDEKSVEFEGTPSAEKGASSGPAKCRTSTDVWGPCNTSQNGNLLQNVQKTALLDSPPQGVPRTEDSLKSEDSLETQTEDFEKQVQEIKQMAQRVQQAAVEHSGPLNNTLVELTQEVAAIREYASNQQDRVKKLQEGYDWNIIKTFCLRIIRCVDNLESRISRLSEQDVKASNLDEIRDELVFALESSGVERFEPEINSDYRGQEKIAEAVKEKEHCDDPNLTGKIAKVIRPGYQYFIDEENVKVVRTAQVKLFG